MELTDAELEEMRLRFSKEGYLLIPRKAKARPASRKDQRREEGCKMSSERLFSAWQAKYLKGSEWERRCAET